MRFQRFQESRNKDSDTIRFYSALSHRTKGCWRFLALVSLSFQMEKSHRIDYHGKRKYLA